MNNAPLGNEAQMAEVRALMSTKEMADTVNQGDKATEAVSVKYTSEMDGKTYEGKFIFKRPNVMEIMKMGGRKSQILKEAGIVDKELADKGVLMMAEAVATLEVVIVKMPEWFIDFQKLEDADLIFHIYGHYTAWSFAFRLNGLIKQEEDSEGAARA